MGKARDFFRSYTSGLEADEFRRLFDRDAARTYAVLARDQAGGEEPATRFRRAWHRIRIAFLGLSAKLTPPRRILFAISLAAAFLALIQGRVETGGGVEISVSPLYVVIAVGGLVYLLALELADRILVRDELEVARQLQRDLLPRQAPDVAGWELAHSYRTANEVGGDYYDFHVLPDGRLAIVAGDASGHGMAAGLVMAIANATSKLALDLDPDPGKVAELLNRALWRTGSRRNFMTLFYGLLDPASGELDFVCAGHPFPILRRAGGECVELGEGSFPLGLQESSPAVRQRARLEPGDTLVVLSDGLFEARNAAGEPFSFERVVAQVAAGGNAFAVHDGLMAALDRFRAAEPLVDDVSLVVVRRGA